MLQHRFYAYFGNLAILLEPAVDQRRRSWRIRISFSRSDISFEQLGITRVGFGRIRNRAIVGSCSVRIFCGGGLHFVRVRIPVDSRIVDRYLWNGLSNDALHHLLNHALLGETAFIVGIICFYFIAQIPMAEQTHFWWEETLALRIKQVIHPDVILRHVPPGFGCGLSDSQVHVSGDAFVKTFCETNLSPLATAPVRTILQTFVKRS